MNAMQDVAKYTILAGIALIVIGGVIWLAGKIPFIGRLPGDFLIKRENFSIYIPLTTCLIISLIVSLLMSLWHKSQ